MMANAWPQVSLSELLRLERRPVKVLPDMQYRCVKLKGVAFYSPIGQSVLA